MKNIKILILIIFILIIGVIVAIISINNINKKQEISNRNNVNSVNNVEVNMPLPDQEGVTEIVIDENAILLTDRNEFFSIEEMLNTYCLYLKVGNIEAMSSIIDSTYKNTAGINNQNILQIARRNLPYDGEYKVKEIYISKNGNINIYYINGILEVNYTKIQNYFTIYKDVVNGSFSLKPITKNEYLTYTSNEQKETYNNSIELTKYNKFVNTIISDEEMAKKYFNSYIHNARYYPDEAYDTLDEEYKNAKFGNVQNYKIYLSNRSTELENLDNTGIRDISEFGSEQEYKKYIYNLEKKSMKQYYINKQENYCVCVDEYDNYYIFKISDVMNYKLMLDTYTLDLPEFLEEYEEADEQEKVALNINKIFKALNQQDYNYVYRKLDIEYRGNKDAESFKAQLSNVLFSKNKVELVEYTLEGNEHKYTVRITDAEGVNPNSIEMSIIMKLGENTDFTIKFE